MKSPNFYQFCRAHKLDFAILTLKEKIEFNQFVRPATLPSPEDTDFQNANLIISGWGKDRNGINQHKLHAAVVQLTPKEDVSMYGKRDNILFVGRSGPEAEGACQGDSGGVYAITTDHRDMLH